MIDKAIQTYISVLKAEVQHLKSKLEAHDTGHIHTTIGTLTHRIKELEEQHRLENSFTYWSVRLSLQGGMN